MKLFRLLLLGLFLLGAAGAGSELILLGHYEQPWQRAPLILIGASLALLAVRLFVKDARVLRAFQICMGLFVVAGAVGVWLHYQSNVEFELEMNPAAAGWGLILEALQGAMPTLAPGTMMYLGFVGLLYAWKHPDFSAGRAAPETPESHSSPKQETEPEKP